MTVDFGFPNILLNNLKFLSAENKFLSFKLFILPPLDSTARGGRTTNPPPLPKATPCS
jgi:hypothetical protein